ncbi:transmembrane proteins 14C-domain-containing protein [Biscogniauxia mediterranea]|nr:transmembrane proteins 14C-domain-containing protein [Biscogniauxia mediterranea]
MELKLLRSRISEFTGRQQLLVTLQCCIVDTSATFQLSRNNTETKLPLTETRINHHLSPPQWFAIEHIAYVLGALTASGGTVGFVKTGSVPSIAAGLTVGVLYGLGGYRIQSKQPYGLELALLASVVLGGSSIPRAIRGRKPVPSVLSLVSIFGLLMFGNAFSKTL